mmetsp:Transcript_50957/g.110331  ORF Transcript_50957/g.110331 Transcript_50957/m.110331 type:complete len:155 (+) Transcript_50957:1477-1941(+)
MAVAGSSISAMRFSPCTSSYTATAPGGMHRNIPPLYLRPSSGETPRTTREAEDEDDDEDAAVLGEKKQPPATIAAATFGDEAASVGTAGIDVATATARRAEGGAFDEADWIVAAAKESRATGRETLPPRSLLPWPMATQDDTITVTVQQENCVC